jgi:hypothetical protein
MNEQELETALDKAMEKFADKLIEMGYDYSVIQDEFSELARKHGH